MPSLPPASPLRLAYVSPLPPESTGIADYSAELLPALAALAEVTAYPEGRAELNERLGVLQGVRPLATLADDVAQGRVDLVVYQLGNSAEHHATTWELVHRIPGVVVLHEYLLHHLVRALTLGRGDAASFAEALRYSAGGTGEAAGRALRELGRAPDPWAFPLFERVVDSSRAVLVHSEFARSRVLQSRPLARVGVIPLPCLVPTLSGDDSGRSAARRRLGIADDLPMLATFGLMTPQKHLEPALRAFARMRTRRPEARFFLVGEISPHYDLAGLLERSGVGDGVTLSGRVGLETFHDFMAACDVAVNLRYPTGGETSATLIRLLALGKAVVVTEAGSFAELPEGSVASVEVGPLEEDQLQALYERLLDDGELREGLGGNARRFARERHSPEAVAQRMLAFLAGVVAAPAAPAPIVPPLAPYPPEAMEIRLVAELAAALSDLGLGEDDREGLEAVAEALVSLDLDLDFDVDSRGGSKGAR